MGKYVSILGEDGFKNLLMPSRGVYPFISHAAHAQIMEEKYSLTGLKIQNKLEEACKNLKYRINSPFYQSKIWIPYTADTGNMSEDRYTFEIRNSWTKLLKCILDKEYNNPNYKLYKYIIENVAEKNFSDSYESKIVEDSGIIYIDTVISGRAATEIIQSFNDNGITNYRAILIVDENGAKLKGRYKKILEKLESEEKVILIKIPRIFTEDRGPSVTGITGIIYPSLMNEIVNKVDDLKGNLITGVGLWDLEVSARADKSNINYTISNAKISTLINNALLELVRGNTNNSVTNMLIDDLIKHINNEKLFNKLKTLEMIQPFINQTVHKTSKVDISSSHVVRIEHNTAHTTRIINEFKNKFL